MTAPYQTKGPVSVNIEMGWESQPVRPCVYLVFQQKQSGQEREGRLCLTPTSPSRPPVRTQHKDKTPTPAEAETGARFAAGREEVVRRSVARILRPVRLHAPCRSKTPVRRHSRGEEECEGDSSSALLRKRCENDFRCAPASRPSLRHY